jgi:hypothetical protein
LIKKLIVTITYIINKSKNSKFLLVIINLVKY